MEYVAKEPQEHVGWADQKGKLHATRDEAIDANIDHDLRAALMETFGRDDTVNGLPMGHAVSFIRTFIRRHPDMVRVMLGDRDAV